MGVSPPIRAVVFDLYGTLIDIWTDEGDLRAYETLSGFLAYLGVRLPPVALREEYARRVETALRARGESHPEVDVFRIFQEILESAGPPAVPGGPAGLARWRPSRAALALATAVLFRAATRRRFGVFPGVPDTLDLLAGRYRLGLVSDAQWVFTEPELELAGLARYFPVPVRVLSSRLGVKKPDPRLFVEVLRRLRVDPEEAVYVGDNPERDLAGARGVGMRCVLFRARPGNGGEGADGWFTSYEELPPLIDRLSRGGGVTVGGPT